MLATLLDHDSIQYSAGISVIWVVNLSTEAKHRWTDAVKKSSLFHFIVKANNCHDFLVLSNKIRWRVKLWKKSLCVKDLSCFRIIHLQWILCKKMMIRHEPSILGCWEIHNQTESELQKAWKLVHMSGYLLSERKLHWIRDMNVNRPKSANHVKYPYLDLFTVRNVYRDTSFL